MPLSPRREKLDRADVALAVHVGICCAVTAGLAFGFYELMQPTRTSNLGLAAYKPPAGAVNNFASAAELAHAAHTVPASIEPPLEAIEASAPQQQAEEKHTNHDLKAERVKRQRAARRKQRRDPMIGYAFQPSFGGYRSWY